MENTRPHTTIGLKKTTKSRLNKERAPGQCYDGFLCQMMDLWDETKKEDKKRASRN
jgi:hypothetical protein